MTTEIQRVRVDNTERLLAHVYSETPFQEQVAEMQTAASGLDRHRLLLATVSLYGVVQYGKRSDPASKLANNYVEALMRSDEQTADSVLYRTREGYYQAQTVAMDAMRVRVLEGLPETAGVDPVQSLHAAYLRLTADRRFHGEMAKALEVKAKQLGLSDLELLRSSQHFCGRIDAPAGYIPSEELVSALQKLRQLSLTPWEDSDDKGYTIVQRLLGTDGLPLLACLSNSARSL